MLDLAKFTKKRICVATSGGADSLSLLHYLKEQQKKYDYLLSAVHCEHGIRGEESIADWKFVENTCREWSVPLYVFRQDCLKRAKDEKTSLETAARDFRFESFYGLIEEQKVDFIATAHHANDAAETVLFRLSRGTSLAGVQGMSEEDDWIIRPFLSWSRQEIEKYAKENGLQYRIDKTNFEKDATRNVLRLDILPALEKAVPGASKNLVRFAAIASEDDALLQEYAQSLLSYRFDSQKEEISVEFCDKKPIFSRACLVAMKALGVDKDYTSAHLDSLYLLQRLEVGSQIVLPQGVLAQKTRKEILFFEKREIEDQALPPPKKFGESGFDGGRYEVSLSKQPLDVSDIPFVSLKIDVDKIPETAVFRFRKEGDTIQRFGGGSKTLKKFFNEKKIVVQEREYLPLIAEADGEEVYVVCGVEISEKVKVTNETKNIAYIHIRYKRKGDN